MQILHPFAGSVQQYTEQLADPDRYRPDHCPQCHIKHPLTAHGFYVRTLLDTAFDGVIRVRRYLCEACRRTVSLLPDFVLPYLRSSLTVIALFLIARLFRGQTIEDAARTAPPTMPYQRGQFWIRPIRAQDEALCATLAALIQPAPAPDFVHRALAMLQSTGWIAAHRFLFAGVRGHLLGWPRGLAPDGRRAAFSPATTPASAAPHTICLECALPLVTCPYLWDWDISRFVQDSGFHKNEMGNWHRYRMQLSAVHKLNEYPHRRREIRYLVPYFVCSGDEDLTNRYAAAIRGFPENVPLSYEQEKAGDGHPNALREKMTLFSEQGDPAHFKAEPTEDGKHTKIWNDPASLKQEKYRVRQQEHEQLNEFASVAIWAQKALDDGAVGGQLSIDEAVTKVKQWDQPGVFDSDDADAFEDKQRTGAIVGAAFIAARYTNSAPGAEVLEWCRGVFDRAISATRKPSRWSCRGTILSLDPLVFAAHGYAALLGKGRDVEHCERALLRLAVDPLEGVQSAVFGAASQFAAARPEFYWLLLEVALGQCVVTDEQIPNYYSILFDAKEAEFKARVLSLAETSLTSRTTPDLPTIPMPWIKSAGPQKPTHRDTKGHAKNRTVFLHHVAAKVLFQAPLEPILADATRREKFLKTVDELLEWTLQEIIPPFANSRHDHGGNTPFEWVYGFAAWCGRVCANLTPAEAHEAILDRTFSQGTDTALMIMQGVTKSFMIQALLSAKAVREFGRHHTLYLAVTTFLKKGGFDLLPRPALAWLEQIAQERKADQEFWRANGDDTVELLGELVKRKSGDLSPDDRKLIILISDFMTDNGVRGASFLHQELLRAEKDAL